MTASKLLEWAIAHPWDFLGRLAAASVAFAAAWASIKSAIQKVTGRAVPRNVLTTTLDVLAELAMNVPGAINRLVQARGGASLFAPPAAPRETQAPPPPSGQSGRVSLDVVALLAAVALVLVGLGAVLSGCPSPVPVDGGPAVTPSSWTATARTVLSTLRWALPAARSITDAVVAEPGRTQVARALDAAAVAAGELGTAVDAYERAGGDRCVARAATAGLHRALVVVAQTLADQGIALGTTLERVVDGVASVADALIPACDPDAGWSSAGDASNATLRAIAARAGRPLSRVLDDLRPAGAP